MLILIPTECTLKVIYPTERTLNLGQVPGFPYAQWTLWAAFFHPGIFRARPNPSIYGTQSTRSGGLAIELLALSGIFETNGGENLFHLQPYYLLYDLRGIILRNVAAIPHTQYNRTKMKSQQVCFTSTKLKTYGKKVAVILNS